MGIRGVERLLPLMVRRGLFMTPWRRPGIGPHPFHQDFIDIVEQEMKTTMNQFRKMMPMINNLADSYGGWPTQPAVRETDGTRKFSVNFDLSHFAPEDINLEVKDGVLSVEAKRSQGDEGSKILREYFHQVSLPEEVKVDDLKSVYYSESGCLTVEAPLPSQAQKDEVAIPVVKKEDTKEDTK